MKQPNPETIEQKADRVLGKPPEMAKLLEAIADGEWTPQDARDLKKATDAGPLSPRPGSN